MVIVGVVGFASPASAHVTVTPSTTAAGAHAVLRFSVEHGCEDSPTTKIAIQIPPQITSVTPTRSALWKVEKRTEKVSEGDKIVERVGSVAFMTDTPLPDGYRDVLELAVQLPDADGTTLTFPTIQTCEQGESAWTEVPQDGQSVGGLELPAPAFTISEPVAGSYHHAAISKPTSPAVPAKADNLTLAALVVGLVGAVVGGIALFRQRRPT